MRYLVACLLTLFILAPVQAKPAAKENFTGRFAGRFMGGYLIVSSVQRGSNVRYSYRVAGIKKPIRGSGWAKVSGDTITDGQFTATLKKNILYFTPPVGEAIRLKRIRR